MLELCYKTVYFGYHYIKIQVKYHLILVLHVVSQSSYAISRHHKLNIVLYNQVSNWKYYIIESKIRYGTKCFCPDNLTFSPFLSAVCVEANFHQTAHLRARQAGQTVPSLRWYHLPARNCRAKQHQSQ